MGSAWVPLMIILLAIALVVFLFTMARLWCTNPEANPIPEAIPSPPTIPQAEVKLEVGKPYGTPNPVQGMGSGEDIWIVDSGCFRHLTSNKSWLLNFKEIDGPKVMYANGTSGKVEGVGSIRRNGMVITEVFYVKGLKSNLLSTSQFCDKGYTMEFNKEICTIKSETTGRTVLIGRRKNNLYRVDWDTAESDDVMLEFKAGKMVMEGEGVVPDWHRGLVRIRRGEEGLVHFQWLDLSLNVVEDDQIVGPEQAVFEKVNKSAAERVYVLKFRTDDRKFYFWMQEPKDGNDAQICSSVNFYLNEPLCRGKKT